MQKKKENRMRSKKNKTRKESSNRVEILWGRIKQLTQPIFNLWKYVLIILLILVLFEVISFFIVKTAELSAGGYYNSVLSREVFRNQSWARDYFKSNDQIKTEYYPYVGYRREANFSSKYINIDSQSRRYTINPCTSGPENASDAKNKHIKIFVFGGSTTWGHGSRDENTIPSLLSKNLCEKGVLADVTNFGESSYTNSQEIILLMLELRQGNRPDYVIFYDGVNDVYASYQDNQAGVPQNMNKRRSEFNSQMKLNILAPIYYNTNFGKIFRKFIGYLPRSSLHNQIGTSAELPGETSRIYFENIRLIESIKDEYGFQTAYFWQPNIYSKKQLSHEEQRIVLMEDSKLGDLFKEVDKIILNRSKELSNFYNIQSVFDNNSETVYFDFCHVSESANQMIADTIANKIYFELKQ